MRVQVIFVLLRRQLSNFFIYKLNYIVSHIKTGFKIEYKKYKTVKIWSQNLKKIGKFSDFRQDCRHFTHN